MAIPEHHDPGLLIGIDIGGTFTDFVVWSSNDQTLQRFKILSTPSDPAEAVLRVLQQLPNPATHFLVSGSTIPSQPILALTCSR